MTAASLAITLTAAFIGLPIAALALYLAFAVVMLPFELVKAFREDRAART